jgi:preprotein translocase subunit SecA
VLNARFHEQEAHIIGRAGLPGAVTIATNMAGRGTDIQLGGNLELRLEEELAGVTDADKIEEITTRVRADISEKKQIALDEGGLYVIGTERHESRRIDNQLRGRTGRQGDPGASKFFLSLEDDLMRIFGSERLDKVLKTFGIEDGEPITHKWVNKALEKAQRKVESHHFDIRKNLLKFDNVMNDQRTVIYDQRREMMEADDLSDVLKDMRHEVVENLVSAHIPARALPDQWDLDGLQDECKRVFALDLPVHDWAHEEGIAEDQMVERIQKEADTRMAQRVAQYGPEVMRYVEKNLLLQVLDQIWKEHLLQLEHLRQGISLRAYGQRDPLNEYKSEAFNLFHHMMSDLQEQITHLMFNVQLQMEPPPQEPEDPSMQPLRDENGQLVDLSSVGRNQPCPCGSGKKFKHCHGRLA